MDAEQRDSQGSILQDSHLPLRTEPCSSTDADADADAEGQRLAVEAVLSWADVADLTTYIAREANGGGRRANAQLLAGLALNLCVDEEAYPFDVSNLLRLRHPGDLAVALQFIEEQAGRMGPIFSDEDFEPNGLATRLVRLSKRDIQAKRFTDQNQSQEIPL